MNLIEKHLSHFSHELSKTDIEVVKCINTHYADIPKMKIKDLAAACYTSVSTLHRVIKKLGFEGFSDFKYRLKDDKEDAIPKEMNDEEYIQKVMSNLKLTKRLNEKEISHVAQVILDKQKRYCFGTGWKQQQSIDNFSTDLLYYGESFTFLRTIDDLRSVSNSMDKDTLLLVVSLSGNAQDYLTEIERCSLKNCTIISVTIDSNNTLSTLADYSLYYKDDTLDNTKKHWNSLTLNFLLDYLLENIVSQKALLTNLREQEQ